MNTPDERDLKIPGFKWKAAGISLGLALMVFAVFAQTLRFEFVNYDDDKNVYENPVATLGLAHGNFLRAFTRIQTGNWIPLTTLSHMLDCQVYGLWAGGHHLSNLLLHTLAGVLLFLALMEMTGALECSAIVAALFCIHPLSVESVAWVSERKDVLSAVFFMLTLGAYSRYARATSLARYAWVALFLALGLMSKPMLVTTPFILLLLDFWPLQRFAQASVRRLALEKLPLLMLSIASGVATVFAQNQTAPLASLQTLSLPARMANACLSYAIYLREAFWPTNLAAFYPYATGGFHLLPVLLSLALLILLTVLALQQRRARPWLVTGWLWYLGMLAPVIGVVQVGEQARADRYTYLPMIGIWMALAWTTGQWAELTAVRKRVHRSVWGLVIAGLMICAIRQTTYWKNSETLWTRSIACNPAHHLAINNLGNAFFEKGRIDEAQARYEEALRLKPDYALAHNNLGNVMFLKGRVDEAITHYEHALQVNPGYEQAQNNLGNALLQKGETQQAVVHLEKALSINPDNADAHYNLGNALLQQGKIDEAIPHYESALRLKPGLAEAHNNLSFALIRQGRFDAAIGHYQQALLVKPDYALADNNFAWLLATCSEAAVRNGARAVELSRRANQLAGEKNPAFMRTLAAAYAEAGRFTEAKQTAKRALDQATAQGDAGLVEMLHAELQLYETGLPFHETATESGR